MRGIVFAALCLAASVATTPAIANVVITYDHPTQTVSPSFTACFFYGTITNNSSSTWNWQYGIMTNCSPNGWIQVPDGSGGYRDDYRFAIGLYSRIPTSLAAGASYSGPIAALINSYKPAPVGTYDSFLALQDSSTQQYSDTSVMHLQVVPEPCTMLTLLCGLGSMAFRRRKR